MSPWNFQNSEDKDTHTHIEESGPVFENEEHIVMQEDVETCSNYLIFWLLSRGLFRVMGRGLNHGRAPGSGAELVGTINVYQWQGKFVRVTMPNPRAAGAARTGAASITPLSSARDVSCEFGTVHPGHMWQR